MASYSGIFDPDKENFLLSGEIHYFRVPKKEWRERLAKLKNAGLNAVSTYIPWNWHELSSGVFDFQGSYTEGRDLETFLEYAREEELGVIAKPGPYICAEWKNGGIPSWLIEEHPEVLARNSRGRPTLWFSKKFPVLTYLHPVYLKQARNWFENVASILSRHQYTKGGSVILVQIDNESSYGFHFWPFDTDYNDIVIGTGNKEGLYHKWLRERYRSIKDLNRRYHLGFDSFPLVEPPRRMVKDNRCLPWIFDWMEFKEDMIANFLSKLSSVLRSSGIDVTLYTNEPYNSLPPASISRKSKVVFDTVDLYPQLIHDLESLTEVVNNIERLKAEQPNSSPLALELQAGWFVSRVPDNMLHFLERLAYIHGLKGVNFYMFSGGANPKGYGTTKRIYYHDAPLDERGGETSKYSVVKRFTDFVNSSEKVTKKLAEFGLGYYHPYTYVRLVSSKNNILGYRTLYRLMEKFMNIVLESGFNFELIDLGQVTLDKLLQVSFLCVFSFDFMERAVVERLLEYVEKGGFLVVLPLVPELDENFESLESMKEVLRVREQKAYNGGWVDVNGSHFKSPIVVTFEADNVEPLFRFKGEVCGFRVNYGKGSVVQLGFLPSTEQLSYILEKIGITKRYCSSSDKILLCERVGENIGYLLVSNLAWREQKCDITFSAPSNLNQKIQIENLVIPKRSAMIWSVGLKIGNSRINYITSEISKLEKSKSTVTLECWGYKNSQGRISLTLPKKPNSVSVVSTWNKENKTLVIEYIHGRENEIRINAEDKIVIRIKGIEALSEASRINQQTYQLKRKIIKRLFG
ncbi:MAG: beta-galactosidase [Candidatus Freyarchaeum deiterrae]